MNINKTHPFLHPDNAAVIVAPNNHSCLMKALSRPSLPFKLCPRSRDHFLEVSLNTSWTILNPSSLFLAVLPLKALGNSVSEREAWPSQGSGALNAAELLPDERCVIFQSKKLNLNTHRKHTSIQTAQ